MIIAKIKFNKYDSGYSLIGFDHDGENFPTGETVDFVMKDGYDELVEYKQMWQSIAGKANLKRLVTMYDDMQRVLLETNSIQCAADFANWQEKNKELLAKLKGAL